jgi:hypothetical protein
VKASHMKEIVLKRRSELEEICRTAHIDPDISTAPEKAIALIESGTVILFLLGNFLLHAPAKCHNSLTLLQNISRTNSKTVQEKSSMPLGCKNSQNSCFVISSSPYDEEE